MPAARYWRVVGVSAFARGDLELSELHLYGTAGRLDASATLTCSHAPADGTLAALQDDDLETTCRFSGAAVRSGGFSLVWDFGVGATAEIIGLRLGASAYQAVFMANCTLQYSSDGTQWVLQGEFARYVWPGAGAYNSAPSAGDADYSKVLLLLPFDGPDGGTAFADKSSAPKTLTANGGAALSATKSKFGGASLRLDGSGDFLAAPPSADFAFGAGDFCKEGWLYLDAYPSGEGILFCLRNAAANIFNNMTRLSPAGRVGWSDGMAWRESSATVPLNQWVHIAIARASGVLRIFINGVQSYEGSHPIDLAGDRVVLIGAYDAYSSSAVGGFLSGYMDDVRITKGAARYTANFTPPVEPFPVAASGSGNTAPEQPTLGLVRGGFASAASAPVPSHSVPFVDGLQMARDVEHGGAGRIFGTTKAKGAAGTPNLPTKSRVVLLHQRSKIPVREVWSDPTTGDFAFEGIDTRQEFLTLAEDAAGNFRPVAASRLVPEVQA